MSEEQKRQFDVKLPKELNLPDDFAVPTYEQWKAQVEIDLKGAPFEKKLITQTYEGIPLNPIYTSKDTENLPHIKNTPGYNNYVRGTKTSGYLNNCWEVSQELPYALAEDFNAALADDLKRGQTAINLSLDTATILGLDADYAKPEQVGDTGVSISGLKSFERSLNNIDIEKYPLHVKAGFSAFPLISVFDAYVKSHKINLLNVKGFIAADPVGYLAVNGSLPIDFDFAFDKLKITTEYFSNNKSAVRTVLTDGYAYNNSGASAVQELAFTLATAVEYLEQLTERGIDVNTAASAIQFSFGVGSFYFMEIAKLRAARILWKNIVEHFGGNEEAQKMNIHAKTSKYNQTIFDPYVNLLRTTTEAFSAVVAGVDSLTTSPFDEVYGQPDEFSRRISRNTQIILKEESHLDQLIDPAGGSFYVEKLTAEVAEAAWKLFQTVEDKGGIISALKDGFVQAEIKKVADDRKKDFAKRKTVIVGNNMYANVKEELLGFRKTDNKAVYAKRAEYLQKFRVSASNEKNAKILDKLNSLLNDRSVEAINIASDAILEGATIGEITKAARASVDPSFTIEKLNLHRASELFEELRLNAAKLPNRKLFLANMGPVSQHKGRADFSRGFFEVGGFDVIYPDGFKTTDEAAEAAINSGAKLVCICSTDDTYPELVPAFVKSLKEKNPSVTVILAGYPKEQIEAHKASGVDEFIFMGADVYAILSALQKKLND